MRRGILNSGQVCRGNFYIEISKYIGDNRVLLPTEQENMIPPNNTFRIVDYVVFGSVLLISLGIGIFYARRGKKDNTTSSFLMADRQMSILPVSMSLLASFLSAITILGKCPV